MEMVDSRNRTDILVVLGARLAREARSGIPNSPAPRTRMFDAIFA